MVGGPGPPPNQPIPVTISSSSGVSYDLLLGSDPTYEATMKQLKRHPDCEDWIRKTPTQQLLLVNDCAESSHHSNLPLGEPLPRTYQDDEDAALLTFAEALRLCRPPPPENCSAEGSTTGVGNTTVELRVVAVQRTQFRVGVAGDSMLLWAYLAQFYADCPGRSVPGSARVAWGSFNYTLGLKLTTGEVLRLTFFHVLAYEGASRKAWRQSCDASLILVGATAEPATWKSRVVLPPAAPGAAAPGSTQSLNPRRQTLEVRSDWRDEVAETERLLIELLRGGGVSSQEGSAAPTGSAAPPSPAGSAAPPRNQDKDHHPAYVELVNKHKKFRKPTVVVRNAELLFDREAVDTTIVRGGRIDAAPNCGMTALSSSKEAFSETILETGDRPGTSAIVVFDASDSVGADEDAEEGKGRRLRERLGPLKALCLAVLRESCTSREAWQLYSSLSWEDVEFVIDKNTNALGIGEAIAQLD